MKEVALFLGLAVAGGCAPTPRTDEGALSMEIRPLMDDVIYYPGSQNRSRDLFPGQEPRMIWEYKFCQFEDPKADLEKAFNELGREGWEYVTIVEHGPVNQFGTEPRFTVFKRPGRK